MIDSSSTSFSDQSVDYSHLHQQQQHQKIKSKTDPANTNKTHPASTIINNGAGGGGMMYLNLPCTESNSHLHCSSSSSPKEPGKTPPWKPMSSFTSFGSNKTTPSKLVEPARQKLNFDDDSSNNNSDASLLLESDNNRHRLVNHRNITTSRSEKMRSRTPSPIGLPLWTIKESALFKRRTCEKCVDN